MGDDPPHGPGPRGFPAQGDLSYHRKEYMAASGR